MRLFAALKPPEDAVEHLDAFLEIRRAAADFRWVRAEQIHLTLAFFAEVDEWRLDDLADDLGQAVRRRMLGRCRIAGGGAFPDPDRAKVLWAGLSVEQPDELELVAAGCRTAGNRVGAAPDGQRFRPHLTLARLGHPSNVTNWIRLLDAYDGPTWTPSTVSLVSSHLGEGAHRRPRYEVIGEFDLG